MSKNFSKILSIFTSTKLFMKKVDQFFFLKKLLFLMCKKQKKIPRQSRGIFFSQAKSTTSLKTFINFSINGFTRKDFFPIFFTTTLLHNPPPPHAPPPQSPTSSQKVVFPIFQTPLLFCFKKYLQNLFLYVF